MVRVSRNLQVAAKLLACAAIAACSSGDDGGEETTPPRVGLIQFPSLYSAFDEGAHTYGITPSVPLADEAGAQGLDPVIASSLKWEVDAKLVKDEGPFDGLPGGRLLTTKGSGNTVVKVSGTTKAGVKVRGEATLKISKASADEWTKGDSRYNNGKMLDLGGLRPMMAAPGEGLCGVPIGAIDIPKDSACSNCHNSQNAFSIEHTPTQTAGYSDDDLIQIFTKAQKPVGGTFNSPILKPLAANNPAMAECLYKAFHTWDIDPETQRGVVFKLRSITPKKQEALDIGRIRAAMMAAAANAGGAAGAPAP